MIVEKVGVGEDKKYIYRKVNKEIRVLIVLYSKTLLKLNGGVITINFSDRIIDFFKIKSVTIKSL